MERHELEELHYITPICNVPSILQHGILSHMRAGRVQHHKDLFMRMNTQQSEVAATVHFAARELKQTAEKRPTETEVLRQVMDWKQKRRPPFEEKEVALTIRNLNMLSWIGAELSSDLPLTEEDVLNV